MPFSLFAGKAKESIALHIDQNSFLSSSNEQIKSLIPGAEFHILESSRGFELKLSEGKLAYEDDLFTAPASIQILSGRDFTINGTTLAASIRTNRVEVAVREDMKSITARSIIGLIILFEVLFI